MTDLTLDVCGGNRGNLNCCHDWRETTRRSRVGLTGMDDVVASGEAWASRVGQYVELQRIWNLRTFCCVQ